MTSPSYRSILTPEAVAVLAVVALACNGDHPADPVDPLDVRVFPSHVFAGGEVFLAGDWYRDSTRSFVLTADTFALAVRRVDDSTIAATVPSTENGLLGLREQIAGTDVDRGSLRVHGFIRSATITMPVEIGFTPSRNPDFPYVITGDSSGVSVIDLRSDIVTRYPGVGRLRYEGSNCRKVVGPTYQDGAFLIWDSAQAYPRFATRWQLIPDTLRQETVFPLGACTMAEVSPHVFVRTGSQGAGAFVSLDSIDDTGSLTPFYYDDTLIGNWGFYWSSGGDRLVLGATEHAGVGVIDLLNRGLAYRVPSLNTVFSAAFSTDGQSIVICGERSNGDDRIIAVNSANGDSLQSLPLSCQSVATDPVLGLVYAVVNNSYPFVSVLVLDPATLTQVGKIDLPASTCFYCVERSVALVDRVTSELIVVSNAPGGVSLRHVSLPPASIALTH